MKRSALPWPERLGQLLLWTYPRGFRDAFGPEVERAIADEWREIRALSLRRRWCGAAAILGDLLLGAMAEWARAFGQGRREPSFPQPNRRHTPRRDTMNHLTQDLRYALRGVAKNPGLTAVIVLILALGIGANTALFSLVDGVLLRPLPLGEPEDLVRFWGRDRETGLGASWTSYPDFVDIEEQQDVFANMAAFRTPRASVSGSEGEPENVAAALVTHDFFAVLGVMPAEGRAFLAEEDAPGAPGAVVLSHGYWRQRFGAEPGIVGRQITVNGLAHTVVGVMPAGFRYPNGSRLWLPLLPDAASDSRGAHRLQVVARLVSGVPTIQAGAAVDAIARRLEELYPDTNNKRGAWVQPLLEAEVGRVATALWVLFGAVGVVLLIACVNVANLLLSRAARRGREMALRTTLGATRSRLMGQLLTESLLLAAMGGVAGCLCGFGLLRLVLATLPVTIPRVDEVTLDARVLLVMLATSLLTGLLFGLFPAFGASRDLSGALSGRAIGSSRHRLQKGLVTAEVALAVVLVAGAGLLVRSFARLTEVEPGFDAENVLTLRLDLPPAQYADWPEVTGFYAELQERVSALPGVRAAAAAYAHPLDPSWTTSFAIENLLEPPPGERPEAFLRPVQPGYFEAMEVELLTGRSFTEQDRSQSPGVVVINESFAKAFFQNENPVGHRLLRSAWWDSLPGDFEIVGVVADVQFQGLGRQPGWAMYYPHRQVPFRDLYLLVKTEIDPLAVADAVRHEIWALDAELPIDNVRTMEEVLAGSVGEPRFQMQLLGSFAGLALLLAAVGLYGVISQVVSQKTGEIGLRLALGAKNAEVFRMVLGQGLRLAALGLALGIVVAFWAVQALTSLLYQTATADPLTFAAVVAVLGLVAVVATYWPARRATRVDPVVALRHD